jgi:crossover junction endodeoxyribonuclease RuvC
MTKLFVGIDPGCSGALVAIHSDGAYLGHLSMPTLKQGGSNRVNGAAVTAWLMEFGPYIEHAYLELVHSMPGQGTSSTFSFGHSAGVIEGILQGSHIPYTLVTPQAWKKSAGLIGSDKDAARSRAIQLYPSLRALDAKAKGQAIADALLIARHGLGVKS